MLVDAENVIGTAARGPFKPRLPGTVKGQYTAIRRGDDCEPAQLDQGPSFPGELAVPDQLATQIVSTEFLQPARKCEPGDSGGGPFGSFDEQRGIGRIEPGTDDRLTDGVED